MMWPRSKKHREPGEGPGNEANNDGESHDLGVSPNLMRVFI